MDSKVSPKRAKLTEPNPSEFLPSLDRKKGFLDLPAELRLLIYEEAASIHKGNKIKLDHWPERPQNSRGNHDCFNLLQTCSQIRSEFQQLYYEHAHFAVNKRQAPFLGMQLHQNNTTLSRLTVLVAATTPIAFPRSSTIRAGQFWIHDYLPVLEMKLRHFPACTIEVASWDTTSRSFTAANHIQKAINLLVNGSATWKKALRKRHVSQVIVNAPHAHSTSIRLVYKVGYEQPWMRQMLYTDSAAFDYAVELGLVERKDSPGFFQDVKIKFGVKY